ncbi:unnamed protein product, partial [Prorocentrum cordatum]
MAQELNHTFLRMPLVPTMGVPVQLRLAGLLEAADSQNLTATDCTIGDSGRVLRAIMQHANYFALETSFVGVKLHQAAQFALDVLLPLLGRPRHIQLCTDGSFKDFSGSSWAFAAVALGESGSVSFLGFVKGYISDTSAIPLDPSIWKDTILSSTTVELFGILWASIWALGYFAVQLKHHELSLPACTIFSDSTSAIGLANGEFGASNNQGLAALLHPVFMLAKWTLGVIVHVGGHANNPWTELADSLAKSEDAKVTRYKDFLINELRHSPALDWCWTKFVTPSMLAAYPFFPEAGGKFTLPHKEVRCDEPPLEQGMSSTKSKARITFSFKVMTYNVCSALDRGPGTTGTKGHRRGDLIRNQILAQDYLLVGIQEARNVSGKRTPKGFIILASGAQKGNLGCELWVSASAPYVYVDGAPKYLTGKHLVGLQDPDKVQLFMSLIREIPQVPIKPHITPDILQAIQYRRRIRHILRTWRRLDGGAVEQSLMHLDVGSPVYDAPPDCFKLRTVAVTDGIAEFKADNIRMHELIEVLVQCLRDTGSCLKRLPKEARGHTLEQLSLEVEAAADSYNPGLEWKILRQLQRFGGRPPNGSTDFPIRMDSQGDLIQSSKDLAQEVLKFFGYIENADTVDWEDLMSDYNQNPKIPSQ